MAGETSGTYFTANAVVDKTAAGTFIPEIWSDEIIAAYQKNLKMAPLVKRIQMSGKKGDVIHIPKPTRGSASAKAESTAVTIQANLESELTVTVDRHFEYSRLIEDIVEVQALNSLRQFYTEDAGYQLALKVDTDLINAATGLSAYAADTVTSGDNFTDLGFREAIKLMDDADVPMEGRCLVVPPAVRKSLMGIERYVSSDFVGGRGVESGLIGNLYGVDIYVSSNAPVIEAAGQNSASSDDTRGCLFFHADALVMAEQMAVRSQTQYKQEYLSTLFTSDTLYGVEVYRPEAGFILAVCDE